MFALASQKMFGRRILVIDADEGVADLMQSAIARAGGTALGPVPSVEDALAYVVAVGRVDCILLDAACASSTQRPIPELFRDREVETIFVSGFDDWFEPGEACGGGWAGTTSLLSTA